MEQLILGAICVAMLAGALAFRKLHKTIDAYAAEKGKNLAQKEDIEALTRIVEDVKQQNAVLLEEHRSRNQLRIASIDRRLQAHQEAYALWRQLQSLHTFKSDDVSKKAVECFSWWDKNCLYLDAVARGPFFDAIIAAQNIVEMRHDRNENPRTVLAELEAFKLGGRMLVEAVALPSLSAEQQPIRPVLDGTGAPTVASL